MSNTTPGIMLVTASQFISLHTREPKVVMGGFHGGDGEGGGGDREIGGR